MPCATRGPAHKLCRSLPRSREDRGKGIHSHAPPPPLPYIPQRIAHRSLPISRTSRKREYTSAATPTLAHATAHRKATSLTPDLRGTRKGIYSCLGKCYPVSSEAEKASCRLSCCSSSDAVLDVREGGRRLAALLADLKAAPDAELQRGRAYGAVS